MKKRAVSLLLVLLMLSTLCMTAFAVSVPEFAYKNGDTYLGTFITSKMSDSNKSILKEWLSAKRTALIRNETGQIHFIIFPTGATVKASLGTNGRVNLLKSGSVNAYGVSWAAKSSSGNYETCAPITFSAGYSYTNCIILGGTIFSEITMPTPVTGYIADVTGDFYLEDDGGLFSDPDSGGGILETIWEWIKNFWKSLLDFVKSIFIPEDGYFEKWYNEIKAAADKKFAALASLYDILKSAFQSVESSAALKSLMLEIPANHFWEGSPAMSADLLKWAIPFASGVKGMMTAIIMLFTGVVCYRRLIVLFEQ